jgi:hypothetical protein
MTVIRQYDDIQVTHGSRATVGDAVKNGRIAAFV